MGLSLLTAVTHVYGLLVVFAYAAAWLISGRRGELFRRLVWAVPALAALGSWGFFAAKAPGYGQTEWLAPAERLRELAHCILGGYANDSETILLCSWLCVVSLLAAFTAPSSWRRLR